MDTTNPSQKDARDRFDATNNSLRKLVRSNRQLLESEATYSCSGQLSIAAAFIWTDVNITNMSFDDGATKIHFEGTAWGVGFGAGTSYGNGWFNVPPSTLVSYDSVSIQVTFAAAGAGGTEISFWSPSGQYLGIFVAAMLGVGAGTFHGSGKFENGAD